MLCQLLEVPGGDVGHFAANSVGVLTAAAGPVHLVVTALAQLKATLGRQVTPQARQNEGHDAHGGPPSAAMGLATRTRVIGAVVFVVVGAVVEKALDAADASPIIDHVLGRAKTLFVTDPTGGKSSRVSTLLALAFPTVLTPVGMQLQIFLARGLEFTGLQLRLGLHSDYPIRNGPQRRPQKSLF